MKEENQINKKCVEHREKCNLICTFRKCPAGKILCEKCRPDHAGIHEQQFIFPIDSLADIHSFDKVSKLKDILVVDKNRHEEKIRQIYAPFASIFEPMLERLKAFEKQSLEMINQKLITYLSQNKAIIKDAVIKKSDSWTLRKKPELMLSETLQEMEVIHDKELLLKANSEEYEIYAEATTEFCKALQGELNALVNICIKLMNSYMKFQKNEYDENQGVGQQNHHEESFMNRHYASYDVADRNKERNFDKDMMQKKRQIDNKDEEIQRAQREVQEKVAQINQLHVKVSNLEESLMEWEKRVSTQKKLKTKSVEEEEAKITEFLIGKKLITNQGKCLNLQKGKIEPKIFNLIIEGFKTPKELDLYRHKLTPEQLNALLNYQSLEILKMNMVEVDVEFLKKALQKNQFLHSLELNSASLVPQSLGQLSSIASNLKHLSIMDNRINDDGLLKMLGGLKRHLESLFVSYNELTDQAIDIISQYSFQIKVLHISKNMIGTPGANMIGKYLKNLQELFIGGTNIEKEGFFTISRNCTKMKRLSLVGNGDVSNDLVSEILFELKEIQWLDISYSSLNQHDLKKIDMLKVLNKNIQIVAHM